MNKIMRQATHLIELANVEYCRDDNLIVIDGKYYKPEEILSNTDWKNK